MPPRFTRIDESIIDEYSFLTLTDKCIFLREYTAGGGFVSSETNQLIFNLKKTMDRRGRPEWRHKQRAIRTCIKELSQALEAANWPKGATVVPVPPSKAKTDQMYDDRLIQILRGIRVQNEPLDVRELVIQGDSREPAHSTLSRRPRPEDHLQAWEINESLASPAPNTIVIFDDVITTGSSFKAMQTLLTERFPDVEIYGLFIARTLHAEEDLDWD